MAACLLGGLVIFMLGVAVWFSVWMLTVLATLAWAQRRLGGKPRNGRQESRPSPPRGG